MWPLKWLHSNHPYHSKVISNKKKLCKIKELLWASSWERHYHVLPSAFTSSEIALNSVMCHVPRISFIAQFHKELFVFLPLLLDFELLKWTDWLRIIHLSKSSNLHIASNQVEAQKILAPWAWNHLFLRMRLCGRSLLSQTMARTILCPMGMWFSPHFKGVSFKINLLGVELRCWQPAGSIHFHQSQDLQCA